MILRFFFPGIIVLFPRFHTEAQYGEYTIRMNRPDNSFYHTSVEGSWKFEINEKGFRNSNNINYEKTKNTFRVLCLGDSHTIGFEVDQEETFSYLLEENLKKQNVPAEVLNAGVSGFSTAEKYIYLIKEGIKYNPDAVVIGFFRNDFDDNIKTGLFELKNDSLIAKNFEHIPGVKIQDYIYDYAVVRWLSQNSYFYSLAFNTVWNYAKLNLLKRSRENVIEYAVSERIEFYDYQKKLTLKLIEEIYKFCRNKNIELIIIDIPSFGLKGNTGSSLPKKIIEDFKLNSDKIILADEIIKSVLPNKIHREEGHRHISPETHLVIAEKISEYLLKEIEE